MTNNGFECDSETARDFQNSYTNDCASARMSDECHANISSRQSYSGRCRPEPVHYLTFEEKEALDARSLVAWASKDGGNGLARFDAFPKFDPGMAGWGHVLNRRDIQLGLESTDPRSRDHHMLEMISKNYTTLKQESANFLGIHFDGVCLNDLRVDRNYKERIATAESYRICEPPPPPVHHPRQFHVERFPQHCEPAPRYEPPCPPQETRRYAPQEQETYAPSRDQIQQSRQSITVDNWATYGPPAPQDNTQDSTPRYIPQDNSNYQPPRNDSRYTPNQPQDTRQPSDVPPETQNRIERVPQDEEVQTRRPAQPPRYEETTDVPRYEAHPDVPRYQPQQDAPRYAPPQDVPRYEPQERPLPRMTFEEAELQEAKALVMWASKDGENGLGRFDAFPKFDPGMIGWGHVLDKRDLKLGMESTDPTSQDHQMLQYMYENYDVLKKQAANFFGIHFDGICVNDLRVHKKYIEKVAHHDD